MKGLSDSARLLYAAVRQAVYAGGAMVAGIAALTLHLQHEDPLAVYCLGAGGALVVLFVFSAIFAKIRSR